MLSCSIWFSAPCFWMGGGLESSCVGRVYGADGAVRLSRTAPSHPHKSWSPGRRDVWYLWVLGWILLHVIFRLVSRILTWILEGAVRLTRTHDLRSGSQDHHPSKNSVQKTICCNSTSNAPDDGRMYLKHVELRLYQ